MSTKLGLGTAQFGMYYGISNSSGQVKKSEIANIIRYARKNRVDLIDTAISYGESEQILGQIGVESFNVITKLPDYPKNCENITTWTKNKVLNSLRRLGVNSIYGLLLHRSNILTGPAKNKLKDALIMLKSEGLVKKIGVSIYDPKELDILAKDIKFDIVQAPLNLIDQRLESSGWLSRLHDDGTEVHTRSTFLQGLLLMSRKHIPSKFNRWSHIWDRWENEIKRLKKSAIEICLSYSLSKLRVNKVIIGIQSEEQFKTVLQASKNIFKLQKTNFIKSEDELLINPFNWNRF